MKKFIIFGLLVGILAGLAGISHAGVLFDWLQNKNAPNMNPTAVRTITADYTIVATDQLIKVGTLTSNITVTLPPILGTSGISGKTYIIQKTDTTAYTINVVASTSDSVANTIEGSTSRYILGTGKMYLTLDNGVDWKVKWETPPVQADMHTGIVTFSTTTAAFTSLATVTATTANVTTANITTGNITTAVVTTATITSLTSLGTVTTVSVSASGNVTAAGITSTGTVTTVNAVVSGVTNTANYIACFKTGGAIGYCTATAMLTTAGTCTCN